MNYIDFTPAKNVASLSDPEDLGVERIWFNTRIDLLPLNIPLDPNPRDQNTQTKVAKDIRQTATAAGEKHFHLMNRGFLMVGSWYQMLPSGKLRVFFSSKKQPDSEYGLGDGGTTYAVLRELRRSAELSALCGKKYITIEVLMGLGGGEEGSLAVNKVVGSRNTSVQVKENSLSDHRGEYDFIKDALGHTPYGSMIRFRENAERSHPDQVFDIQDLITILTLLNPNVSPQERNGVTPLCHGSNVWGQAGSRESLFKNNKDSYHKFAKILPQILEIHDGVGISIAGLYNAGYRGKVKAGNLGLFTEKTPYRGDRTSSPFLKKHPAVSGCFPEKALWYAIIGSFRSLVVERHGVYEWRIPFVEVNERFRGCAHKMVTKARKLRDIAGRSTLDYAARVNSELWEGLYEIMARTSDIDMAAE